jgi:DNA mismatch repair protein MutS
MAKEATDTPLMQQHRQIKQKYPDAILLFRVGDFYETFGEDAILSAKILGITLTKRNNGSAFSAELAGFPHHALDTYLHQLVKAGYRVAICDQLEDPRLAKGIVKRGVTELVTPGLATHDKLLDHRTNNFLAGLHWEDGIFGLAFLDISTGEFLVAEGDVEYADKLLQTFRPAEIIFQRSYQKQFKESFGLNYHTYTLESWIFDEHFARESLLKQFKMQSLKGFAVDDMHQGLTAAGAILHYLKETEHPNLEHVYALHRMDRKDFLWMDAFTIRNLEIMGNPTGKGKGLINILDNTVSSMGARLLKRWMVMPLINLEKIRERQDLVEFLVREVDLRNSLSRLIRDSGDVERLAGRIPTGRINPREIRQLALGFGHVSQIRKLAEGHDNPYFRQLAQALDSCPALETSILTKLVDQPPVAASKGGLIRPGVSGELDELRSIASGGRNYLQGLQERESENTGISSLKIGFNSVFGYFLEVTNAHKGKVPAEWIRKQTLVNAERYITPELKEYEVKITGAEEKIQSIEWALYENLLAELRSSLPAILQNGECLAILDCLVCFAQNAVQFNYKKPEMHEGLELVLKESRHPVIERNLPPGESYVANDLVLDPSGQQIIILTGPNMSGKSALLRQTALITLMAHTGSFVPADYARIPLTDRIFTRVGASDNLSGGESTFMVEMNETASIINNISPASLVILDEIGRGTATYDGISIAWSIAEYLHHAPESPKTLFATHYHELNELENRLPRVKNYHITNRESGNKVIFLRKLAPGGSLHSFGIHVAKMAGMPPLLIQRANEILLELEKSREKKVSPELSGLRERLKTATAPKIQLSIFDAHSQTFEEIRKMLTDLDINHLTPVEALMKLLEIKKLLK